jgi:hypothetical protein
VLNESKESIEEWCGKYKDGLDLQETTKLMEWCKKVPPRGMRPNEVQEDFVHSHCRVLFDSILSEWGIWFAPGDIREGFDELDELT